MTAKPLRSRLGSLLMAAGLAASVFSVAPGAAWAAPTPTPAPGAPATDNPDAPDHAGLEQALRRDLGISLRQFIDAGATAERAKALADSLKGDPGFRDVMMRDGNLIVIGTGAGVTAQAAAFGAVVDSTLVDPKIASVTDLAEKYRAELGDDGLRAVVLTSRGYEIRVDNPDQTRPAKNPAGKGAAAGAKTPRQFAAQFSKVSVAAAYGPAKGVAATDVYAGSGFSYGTSYKTICSVGFPAFDGNGNPLTISAGHCTVMGGSIPTYPTIATNEPAWTSSPSYQLLSGPSLGTPTWTGFGVPGQVATSTPKLGTDFTVIGGPSSQLTLWPNVMKWRSSGTSSPTDNAVHVTGTAAAIIGSPVCRSGRTTGWKCAKIDDVGEIEVWADSAGNQKALVWSAVSLGILADHGDSGGPWIVGQKAVGVTSAVGCNYSPCTAPYQWGTAALLVGPQEGSTNPYSTLAQTRPDIAVKLWLGAPTVPGGASVWQPGAVLSGTVPIDAGDTLPPNTKVTITTSTGWTTTAPVNANGSFSFTYNGPVLTSTTSVKLTAINGFSKTMNPTVIVGTTTTTNPTGASAIQAKYTSLGGSSGRLGAATSQVTCDTSGTCYQTYAGGAIFWTSGTGAKVVWGAIWQRYQQLGASTGPLGVPTADEACGLTGGGCWQAFAKGAIYWSPNTGAWESKGAIRVRYGQMGYENGRMGYPTGGEVCGIKNGGCYQMYQGGAYLWSSNSGAWESQGGIRTRYSQMGYENSQLGYPTGAEVCGIKNGGCYQMYEGGAMLWSSASGAWESQGAIRSRYGQMGFENSIMGYPTGAETCGLRNGGCYQMYQGGAFLWSGASGAWENYGNVRSRYMSAGGENSFYGYPTNGITCGSYGCTGAFQGGYITA